MVACALISSYFFSILALISSKFCNIPLRYYSPYPEDFAGVERLYLCEFCLKYASTPLPQ
jgi:MYST family zinc finger domain